MDTNGWTELDVESPESVAPLSAPHWVYCPKTGEVAIVMRHPGSSVPTRLDAGGRSVRPRDEFLWKKPCSGAHGPLPDQKIWKNPLPVVVMIVETEEGVLLVRRAGRDGHGCLALPGGFQEIGETWQEAGCREVAEETGAVINPEGIRVFDVDTVEDGKVNLIYGVCEGRVSCTSFAPQEGEILEVLTTREQVELAFPSHTERLARYLSLR